MPPTTKPPTPQSDVVHVEANAFKRWREEKGMTQFEAAVAMGITPSGVSGWEQGQPPRLSLCSKIASVYGVPIDQVLRAAHELSMAAKAQAATD